MTTWTYNQLQSVPEDVYEELLAMIREAAAEAGQEEGIDMDAVIEAQARAKAKAGG